jgi:hypothetical protein
MEIVNNKEKGGDFDWGIHHQMEERAVELLLMAADIIEDQ